MPAHVLVAPLLIQLAANGLGNVEDARVCEPLGALWEAGMEHLALPWPAMLSVANSGVKQQTDLFPLPSPLSAP